MKELLIYKLIDERVYSQCTGWPCAVFLSAPSSLTIYDWLCFTTGKEPMWRRCWRDMIVTRCSVKVSLLAMLGGDFSGHETVTPSVWIVDQCILWLIIWDDHPLVMMCWVVWSQIEITPFRKGLQQNCMCTTAFES